MERREKRYPTARRRSSRRSLLLNLDARAPTYFAYSDDPDELDDLLRAGRLALTVALATLAEIAAP